MPVVRYKVRTEKDISDAALIVLGNTSNTNTGDNATNSQYSGLVTNANHSGEVTGSAALTITEKAVTLAKMADLAQNTIIGRVTASTGVPQALSAANVRTIINVADGATAYTHPNHSGEVTSNADGAQTIANSAVTLAKMANMATASLIYRKTAEAGAPEVNTLATLKTDLGIVGFDFLIGQVFS